MMIANRIEVMYRTHWQAWQPQYKFQILSNPLPNRAIMMVFFFRDFV